LKRAQEKISVEELANELDQLKKIHKKNVEETDKRREEEFNKFLEGMKTIKNEISEKLVIEQEKNKENIVAISNDFKSLKNDLTSRIENIETNQKKQIENVKILLEKGGGKSKNLIKKIITGKLLFYIDNPEELQKVKNSYFKPTKSEISQMKKQLNEVDKVNEKIKGTRLRNKKETMERDEEIDYYIKRKKELNDIIQKENKIHKEIVKKSSISSKIFDKIKLEKINQERQSHNQIKKYLNIRKSFRLSKLGKLRSYVYTCMYITKLRNIIRENKLLIKSTSLNYFIKSHENFENVLVNWVYSSIKSMYFDIISDTSLIIDLSDSERGIGNKQQIEERYIKLETRIQNIFEMLIKNTNPQKIEGNLAGFLQVLTSEGSCIPYNYYSFFEVRRLHFEEDCLK